MKRALAERASKIDHKESLPSSSRSRVEPESNSTSIQIKVHSPVGKNSKNILKDNDLKEWNRIANGRSVEKEQSDIINQRKHPTSSAELDALKQKSNSKKRLRENNMDPPPQSIASNATTDRDKTKSSSHKRKRSSVNNDNSIEKNIVRDCNNDEQNEDEDSSSAFYLRLQNRALVTELHQLKNQAKLLEAENNQWRISANKLKEDVESIELNWKASLTTICYVICLMNIVSGNHIDSHKQKHTKDVLRLKKKEVLCNGSKRSAHERGDNECIETPVSLHTYIVRVASSLEQNNPIQKFINNDQIYKQTDEEGGKCRNNIVKADFVCSKETATDVMKNLSYTVKDILALKAIRGQKNDTFPLRNGLQKWVEHVVSKIFAFAQCEANDTLNDIGHLPTQQMDYQDIKQKISDVSDIHKDVLRLEQIVNSQKERIKLLESEKENTFKDAQRLRKSIYRISSGYSKVEDVLKYIEGAEKYSISCDDGDDNGKLKKSLVDSEPISSTSTNIAEADVITSSSYPNTENKVVDNDFKTSSPAAPQEHGGSENSLLIAKKMKELETLAQVREKKIGEMNLEVENLEKRLNSILADRFRLPCGQDLEQSIPSEYVRQTDTYKEAILRLKACERNLSEAKSSLERKEGDLAVSIANCEHLKKMIIELTDKHVKQLENIVNENIFFKDSDGLKRKTNAFDFDDNFDMSNSTVKDNNILSSDKSLTKDEISRDEGDGSNSDLVKNNEASHVSNMEDSGAYVKLEHKLQQALEVARQVDGLKNTLSEASKLNDSLQAQATEWKAKYIAASKKSSSRHSTSSQKQTSTENNLTASASATCDTSSSTYSKTGNASIDRLKTDFRKCRKELAAEKNRCENYKAKNERLENQRDSMMRINSRLVKQSTEKEEMNTKSLSSILHLKRLTDLRAQEIETMEQKSKATEQLAVSSRLASYAKSKIEDEMRKDKLALEKKLSYSQAQVESLQKVQDEYEVRMTQSDDKLKCAFKDVESVQKRCNELANTLKTRSEEKIKLAENLALVKREGRESGKNRTSLSLNSSGSSSSFSTDQLSAHLSVLKSRLACPVCNDREKQCILLRCRHMFCKHCVDENIKNRSRKCPACGQRFDTKDVGDIWL